MPLFMTAYAIFSPMQDALALSTNYGFVYGAAKRVFDLLQLKPVVLDNGKLKATEVVSEKSNCLVEFDTVCFTYPSSKTAENGRFVLSGASFSLKSGETVALVSSSGGGKTTVARLLQRFWDIDSGSIKINGVDVRELQLQELRDIVTVVPQDVYLFNESIYENLRLAKIDASKAEIIEACKSAQAEGYINALPKGFDTAVGERGLRLSGGEKQRLSIAQAFLKNSPVLVLDEASASLDTENEMLINQAVERLKAGRATMIIAHRLSTIKSADRIIFLCDGVVEGQGTFEELSSLNSRFKELVGSDFT